MNIAANLHPGDHTCFGDHPGALGYTSLRMRNGAEILNLPYLLRDLTRDAPAGFLRLPPDDDSTTYINLAEIAVLVEHDVWSSGL